MEKLIEIKQENLIICDNPECDFVVPNETQDPFADTSEYINVACPKCGRNLLTEEDQKSHDAMLRIVRWMNKWFSWITIFLPSKKRKEMFFHAHNGITSEQHPKSKS